MPIHTRPDGRRRQGSVRVTRSPCSGAAHRSPSGVELAGGDPLACQTEDVGRRDRPGHRAAAGWARRLATAATEEGGDSTGRGAGAEVDVGCGHGGGHAAERELERERQGVLVEFGLERAEPRLESVCGTSS
jgi:hypothetical protein